MSLRPEKQVRNYLIQDIIASGGMGVVWRAWDLKRNDLVAIKAIASDLIADPHFEERFLDEVHRHARLNHPHIVPVLDAFEADGLSCMVMKLVEGKSLADLLEAREHHRLEMDEALPIVGDVLDALDYAHRQGIIHRDIKPTNILLDQDHRAQIIDFGIALAVGEQRRTRTGQILGTPLYMSPEQIRKPRSIDHRSDVYSVGCVFYEMLTGRPPFLPDPKEAVTDTDFVIKEAHLKKTPLPPRSWVATIPADVDRLILWALEKDPEKRLPGCREFLRQLTQCGLADKGHAVPPPWKKPIRLVVGLVLVLICVLIFLWLA